MIASAAFFTCNGSAQSELHEIEKRIDKMSAEKLPEIPRNRKGPSDRIEACLIFKYFPSEFSAGLLKINLPIRRKPRAAERINQHRAG